MSRKRRLSLDKYLKELASLYKYGSIVLENEPALVVASAIGEVKKYRLLLLSIVAEKERIRCLPAEELPPADQLPEEIHLGYRRLWELMAGELRLPVSTPKERVKHIVKRIYRPKPDQYEEEALQILADPQDNPSLREALKKQGLVVGTNSLKGFFYRKEKEGVIRKVRRGVYVLVRR